MPVSLPTTDDFATFWGDEADNIDTDRASVLISLAANLLWLATSIEKDPLDQRLNMLVQYAILDMAIYIYVTRDDIDARYSPFQSERIGSYNYSKEYSRLTNMVVWNEPTGVAFFDRVVAELIDSLTYDSMNAVSGIDVFTQQYIPFPIATYRENIADIDQARRGWNGLGFPNHPHAPTTSAIPPVD